MVVVSLPSLPTLCPAYAGKVKRSPDLAAGRLERGRGRGGVAVLAAPGAVAGGS